MFHVKISLPPHVSRCVQCQASKSSGSGANWLQTRRCSESHVSAMPGGPGPGGVGASCYVHLWALLGSPWLSFKASRLHLLPANLNISFFHAAVLLPSCPSSSCGKKLLQNFSLTPPLWSPFEALSPFRLSFIPRYMIHLDSVYILIKAQATLTDVSDLDTLIWGGRRGQHKDSRKHQCLALAFGLSVTRLMEEISRRRVSFLDLMLSSSRFPLSAMGLGPGGQGLQAGFGHGIGDSADWQGMAEGLFFLVGHFTGEHSLKSRLQRVEVSK